MIKAVSHEPATNTLRERELFEKVEAIRIDPNLAFPNFGIEGTHSGRHLSSETATSAVQMQRVEEVQGQRGIEERGNIAVSGPLLYQIRERLRERFPRLFGEAEAKNERH